ncbi:MAG: O-acetylhomoserine aminocarboxypropyltransferase/cysteine synthase family protein [Acutalibacteraceae bacterium]|nr:O-acetylhomoserine aminocarboxypropyltransferase/cysteine synthase family protein [Acutalibacteraceae bacterium]
MSGIETKCLHEGYTPKNGEASALPIYQSTTFRYDSVDTLGDLFDLKAAGHFYTRLSNPTVEAPEIKLAALEGGVGAMLTSAGQAASLISVINIAGAGDNIICSAAVYGGTFNLFNVTLRKLGIDTTFVDPNISAEELQTKIKPNTKLIFGETLTNPSLDVLDIEKFAAVAHDNKIPLIVDNTFPTPVLCRPFEFGADIVVHSTSKFLDGHAVVLGGAIVDSGNFDWEASGKFDCLTTPDDSYHGVIYTKSFGKAAYITKARTQLMRDLGCMMSPNSAFILNMNMETLPIRMERHCKNALAVAKHLENHPKIAWVNYPGLESNKYYSLAQKYLPDGCSAVISYGVKGGKEAAKKYMENLKLASLEIHVADIRTCCLHPATTTHRQLTDEQLKECGVSADLIRMSIGLESVDDIIADIDSALENI